MKKTFLCMTVIAAIFAAASCGGGSKKAKFHYLDKDGKWQVAHETGIKDDGSLETALPATDEFKAKFSVKLDKAVTFTDTYKFDKDAEIERDGEKWYKEAKCATERTQADGKWEKGSYYPKYRAAAPKHTVTFTVLKADSSAKDTFTESLSEGATIASTNNKIVDVTKSSKKYVVAGWGTLASGKSADADLSTDPANWTTDANLVAATTVGAADMDVYAIYDEATSGTISVSGDCSECLDSEGMTLFDSDTSDEMRNPEIIFVVFLSGTNNKVVALTADEVKGFVTVTEDEGAKFTTPPAITEGTAANTGDDSIEFKVKFTGETAPAPGSGSLIRTGKITVTIPKEKITGASGDVIVEGIYKFTYKEEGAT